jgi:radical SAM-linked protein
MQRLRLTFAKTAAMKFSGHLDLHRAWERTLRRARLPLAYSEGFNPQPKIQLASALPLGFTSECEVADVSLETPQDLEAARAALEQALPPGIVLRVVVEVPERGPALQTQVIAAEYRVVVTSALSPEAMDERIAALLAARETRRVRRGKEYDLRPLIESLERAGMDELGYVLLMRLAAREGATGRPEEVVDALGLAPAEALFHRQRLLFK